MTWESLGKFQKKFSLVYGEIVHDLQFYHQSFYFFTVLSYSFFLRYASVMKKD